MRIGGFTFQEPGQKAPSQCCPPARLAATVHPTSRRETAITTIAHPELTRVTIGVDTHLDVHVVHAKDGLGRRLATTSVQRPRTATEGCSAGARAWARSMPGGWRAPAAMALR